MFPAHLRQVSQGSTQTTVCTPSYATAEYHRRAYCHKPQNNSELMVRLYGPPPVARTLSQTGPQPPEKGYSTSTALRQAVNSKYLAKDSSIEPQFADLTDIQVATTGHDSKLDIGMIIRNVHSRFN